MKLGKLPKGWEWKRLRDVCETTSGGTPPRNVEQYFNGKIPWLKSGELENNIIFSTEETITEEGLENSSSKIIPKGTPLIALYGATVGKVGILGIDCAINQAICAIFPSEKINPTFLFYFLIKSRQSFLDIRAGGAQPNISQDIVQNIQIPLPPLPVQRQIVAVLEQAEALKRWRQEADALMGALLQSVFYEMFGDPVRNDGGWEITNFGKCCKSIRYGVGMPPQYRDGGIPFVRATNIKNGTIVDNNLKFVSIEDSKEIEKCRIHHGDLIVVRSGVNTGDAAFVPHKFEGALAGFDLIVEFNNPAQTLFFNFLINSQYGKSQINLYKRRAAQEHLNSEQLSSLRVPNPPLALQQQFARVVTEVERIRERQAESRREIEGLCEGLMQGAFAGELVA